MKELKEIIEKFYTEVKIEPWTKTPDSIVVMRNYDAFCKVAATYADMIGEAVDKTGINQEWGILETNKADFLKSFNKSLNDYFLDTYIMGLVELRPEVPSDFTLEAMKLVCRFCRDYCPRLADYLTSTFVSEICFIIDDMGASSKPEICAAGEPGTFGDRVCNSNKVEDFMNANHIVTGVKGAVRAEN